MSTRVRIRLVALTATAVVTICLSPPAYGDHDDLVIPSKQAVLDAQQRVQDTERSVASIQADLATADAQLESLSIAAEKASERYNGALVLWHESRSAAVTARRRADQAAASAEVARSQLAGFVVGQETTDSQLTTFSTALTAGGPHDLMVGIANYDASSQAYDAEYQAWQASDQLAKVYEEKAELALEEAEQAKADAKQARQQAKTAVTLQQNAVVAIGAQRASLLQELARAQNISVSLATQRQVGLEQRRQERIAEQRRLEQLQALREQRRQEQREQARIRELRRIQHLQQLRRQRQQPQRHTTSTPAPTPAPPPSPPPVDPTPPPNATRAQIAINFAYNQLGEPYVWGAAGPDAWDCSGLTMGAWAAAGVSLPHYSVAQYAATTPISVRQLRPGDLVFWADNPNDPGTIFHVGLYIGDNNMIHAARTGEPVKIENIWYWETPDFFGRPR